MIADAPTPGRETVTRTQGVNRRSVPTVRDAPAGFPKSMQVSDGIGTALKPAAEFWWLARKPFKGTAKANFAAHGTGGLNVEACRVAGAPEPPGTTPPTRATGGRTYGEMQRAVYETPSGRWPPSLLLTHSPSCTDRECVKPCPVRELDEQSGNQHARGNRNPETYGSTSGQNVYGTYGDKVVEANAGDSGGASRFFPIFRYVAKPSRAERDAGLWDFDPASGGEATDREEGSDGLKNPRAGAGRGGGARNRHPTVKPIALMEWLCQLVTPRGGTILDPFLGSGTTGCAAVRLGFNFIGIDREAAYLEIAERRIALAANAPRTKGLGELERGPEALPGQLSLLESA